MESYKLPVCEKVLQINCKTCSFTMTKIYLKINEALTSQTLNKNDLL